AHVRAWSQTGSRLQVWLSKPVAETSLLLSGSLPRGVKDSSRFDMPGLRVEARKLDTAVRVTADEGVALTPGTMTNLVQRTLPGTTSRDLLFSSDQDVYGGTFAAAASVNRADLRLLTFAEVRERELSFTSTLEAHVTRGELRHLTVSVR